MSLRAEELEQVVAELNTALTGAFVQKAHAPLQRLAFLELRQPGRSTRVCLSAEPSFSRVSVTEARFPSPETPHPFQRWLRHHLIGARLQSVDVPAPHVARFTFETKEGIRNLVGELRGTGANVFLLDGEDRVLHAFVPEGVRTKAGTTWEPPFNDAAPTSMLSRLEPKAGSDFPLAEAAEALFGARETERRAQEIRKRLTGPLRAKVQRLDRTIEKVTQEAQRAPDAERHRILGEVLTQNAHRIPRGQKTARLTRYAESGVEELEVTIAPTRTAKEQADWHFHQYRRLTHGIAHAQRRLAELQAERSQLSRELEALEAKSEDDLFSQVEVLAAPRKKGPERAKPFKEFLAFNGARILVGRSSESNDELTFRSARPFDLWLHARGVPGSHVVLECTKNQEVHPEALLDAAHLAHHHSQNKSEPRGEVAYTQVKFVKKQKGGAPGQVTFTRDRTLNVRMEPERLKRLMGSGPT